MIKLFKKIKDWSEIKPFNFTCNRINKLIKTKSIKKYDKIHNMPLRTVYLVNDTVYIYQDDDSLNGRDYFVRENGKEIDLNYFTIAELFDLAKKQYLLNNN
jgi:hypothetical protein